MAFQEGHVIKEVPRNFPVSRLVSSTRNLDLELCSSSRILFLLTMALRRGEAGVPVFHPVLEAKVYSWNLIPNHAACQPFSFGRGLVRSGLYHPRTLFQSLCPQSWVGARPLLTHPTLSIYSQVLSSVHVTLGRW